MKNGSFFGLVEAVSRGRYFFIGPRVAVATYVHVEDVVRALVACQNAPNGGVYNLSSDCTWEALIARIASLVGVRSPLIRIPAAPLAARYSSSGRARATATNQWATGITYQQITIFIRSDCPGARIRFYQTHARRN